MIGFKVKKKKKETKIILKETLKFKSFANCPKFKKRLAWKLIP